jgi:hypothetical protein
MSPIVSAIASGRRSAVQHVMREASADDGVNQAPGRMIQGSPLSDAVSFC